MESRNLVTSTAGATTLDIDAGPTAWIDRAVVYGIVVRNVSDRGFDGAASRLDDLADLGIDAIWLAPITPTLPGCFGYEVLDYHGIRPEYGTHDDFRRFVRAAHERGIRVLLDVVPNHTSSQHPWFREAERDGPGSPMWNRYDRDETGQPTHYFDWTHLPNLNFDNPEVRQLATEAMLAWVRDFDVDGFRVDVAWGIRQRYPAFWPEFCAEFRRLKPDGLLIAEASARDPFYADSGFDAAYDWTDALGQWAWNGAFDGTAPVGEIIASSIAAADPATRVFRFLNNNDTGERFITRHGEDVTRVAMTMLLTLPGLPCLYLGDEVGAEFQPYAQAGPIAWGGGERLREHTRRLIALRHELPGLAETAWTPLASDHDAVFAYLRHQPDGSSPVLILLNFSDQDVTVRLDVDTLPSDVRAIETWTDHLSEDSDPVSFGSTYSPDPLLRHAERSEASPGEAGPPEADASHAANGMESGDLVEAHDSRSALPPSMPVPAWGTRVLVPTVEADR